MNLLPAKPQIFYQMKTKLLLSLGLLGLLNPVFSQTVRHSTQVEDQIILGPCYTFALMAALESNALENDPQLDEDNINFNEWVFYSNCVVPREIAWAGVNQIQYSLQHAHTYGATNGPIQPTTTDNCPNSQYDDIPCFAKFGCSDDDSWCKTNTRYSGLDNTDGIAGTEECYDDGGTRFDLRFLGEHDYIYEADGALWERSDIPDENTIANALASGRGVVAIFDDYLGTEIQHAVFIFSKIGDHYTYKDSWPGDAGIKSSQLLNDERLTRTYVLTGVMRGPATQTQDTSCDYTLSGPTTLSESSQYSLTGGTGTVFDHEWTLVGPSGSAYLGDGTTVSLDNTLCGLGQTQQLQVSYWNEGNSCLATLDIDLPGASTPSIQINGPSSLSAACPGSAIQLEAVSAPNTNPDATTTYEWTVSGATLLNGQGTKYLNIELWDIPEQYQQYKVRSQKDGCSWTPWTTVTGYIAQNCGRPGGGIGIFPRMVNQSHGLDLHAYFLENPSAEEVLVSVVTLEGKQLVETCLNRRQSMLNTRDLPAGWIFVRLVDEKAGRMEVQRHRIGQ